MKTDNDAVRRNGVRLFSVTSAEYTTYFYGLDCYDPPEYGCDYALVRTSSKARARVLAVRYWRHCNALRGRGRLRKLHLPECESVKDGNPFRGLKVEPVTCECGATVTTLRHFETCAVAMKDAPDPGACEACEGTGNGLVHGVEDWCGACDGTGRKPEA